MLDTELRRPSRFHLDQMSEVIAKAVGGSPVEPCPKRGFGNRHTTAPGHAVIVVRGPADHVDMRIDVVHVMDSG
jgi:hypothetical protein